MIYISSLRNFLCKYCDTFFLIPIHLQIRKKLHSSLLKTISFREKKSCLKRFSFYIHGKHGKVCVEKKARKRYKNKKKENFHFLSNVHKKKLSNRAHVCMLHHLKTKHFPTNLFSEWSLIFLIHIISLSNCCKLYM